MSETPAAFQCGLGPDFQKDSSKLYIYFTFSSHVGRGHLLPSDPFTPALQL